MERGFYKRQFGKQKWGSETRDKPIKIVYFESYVIKSQKKISLSKPRNNDFVGPGKLYDSFSFSPTSHDHQFYGVTSNFIRLIMKSKYVWHSLTSPHAKFHNDQAT